MLDHNHHDVSSEVAFLLLMKPAFLAFANDAWQYKASPTAVDIRQQPAPPAMPSVSTGAAVLRPAPTFGLVLTAGHGVLPEGLDLLLEARVVLLHALAHRVERTRIGRRHLLARRLVCQRL